LVAGGFGVAMFVAPRSTDRYFSWPIGPPPLAAAVGACYVASAVVFAWAAAREDWPGTRGLCWGALALTVPTLVSTARHHDVFDFSRWLAIAWVVLFVAGPCVFAAMLLMYHAPDASQARDLTPTTRAVVAVLGLVYATATSVLWFVPSAVSGNSPFPLAGMGARFLGSWAAFLATLAGYSVVRGRFREARTPLLALTVFPLAVLVAGLVRLDDLRSGARRAAYVTALVVLAAAAFAALLLEQFQRRRTDA
jgi:hypothetical protein